MRPEEAIAYTEGSFLWIMNNMFFQYYSILILIVSAIAMVVVSYMTREPDYEKISGLTYGTVTDADREESRSSWGFVDVAASAVVLGRHPGSLPVLHRVNVLRQG
jgi:SSS family solute:Na+ symporter